MKAKEFLASLLAVLMLGLAACAPAASSSAASTDESIASSHESAAGTDDALLAQSPEATGPLVFTTKNLDGSDADQSIFEDYTLTMVNMWGTFCGPCLSEMPELGKLAAEYADKGVQIVGVVCDVEPDKSGNYSESDIANARELVTETGADYPHLLFSTELAAVTFPNLDAVPTTFFVDGTGTVVGETIVGTRTGEDWASIIDETLAEVAK